MNKKVQSKLLFVGDGPERTFIERLARECSAHHDIRFLGRQEQMEDILAITDLFILPSEYESFGLVALEAMASSVPVVSAKWFPNTKIFIRKYYKGTFSHTHFKFFGVSVTFSTNVQDSRCRSLS